MNFKKIAAGILACTMSVSLFGCELVSVNKERDNAQIVLTVGDKSYSKEMVRGLSTSALEMYGVENPEDKAYDEYRETVAESFAKQKAMQHYVIANGYGDKLTEEDEKEINENYEAAVKHYNEEILEEVKTSLGYTGEEGAPEIDEEAQAKIDKKVAEEQKAYLMQLGVTSIEEYKE
ncbi:MAG: hypothetical protein IJR47_03955, partial [Clostridia bacterium]|nr:hypothetical protein [Clostridia bacterium]